MRKNQVDEVVRLIRDSAIDVAVLLDEPKNFSQTPIFAASVIPDGPEAAFKMIKVLTELGVDPTREDTLKQTPLFYLCREGNAPAIDFLLARGDNVSRQDRYGQTPIYYAVREGHIRTAQQLIEKGAAFDHADTKNQRPIYYAIQHNRFEMVKFLIDKGADLHREDKKGMTPTQWAKKQNRVEILSLLLEHGGVLNSDKQRGNQNRRPKPPVVQPQPVVQPADPKAAVLTNEKKIPRRYMLTKLREDGYYSPMTDSEFEEFKRQNPQMARYFEEGDDGQTAASIDDLAVPEVPESAPIFDQWEKAAQRMLTNL